MTEQERRRRRAADACRAEFSGKRETGGERHVRFSDICDGGIGGGVPAEFPFSKQNLRYGLQ